MENPFEVSVLAPDDSVPLVHTYVETVQEKQVSWEARTGGVYTVVLLSASLWTERGPPSVLVEVREVEGGPSLAARREAIPRDPRLANLVSRAIRLRTLDPEDTSFGDLQALKNVLHDVQLVLLGEATHGDGSTFYANSRLIRFLHSEMDFDVLAFESGMYGMWRAWREIALGEEPTASFGQGAYPQWAKARQLGPLVEYIAQTTQEPRPLVLAGIDVFSSGSTPPDTMISELTRFLQAHGLEGPFTDSRSPENGVLARLHQYNPGPSPDSATLVAFENAVASTAGRIERELASLEARYWAGILRNAERAANWNWKPRGTGRRFCATDACRSSPGRDPEMVQNLIRLATRLYPGHKIIVWAASAHVGRNLTSIDTPGWIGDRYTLGDGAKSEFGDLSYAIAPVSYEGVYYSQEYTIVPDQDLGLEFEELMAAAGYEMAFVDLRGAVSEDSWLGESFLARPVEHSTMGSRWSENYDAFLFIKRQESRSPAPEL
jgi:erythromycin esterase